MTEPASNREREDEAIARIKDRFVPRLAAFAAELRIAFPGVSVNVFVHEPSEGAVRRRFEIFLDCTFREDRPREQADEIALEIGLDLADHEPRFSDADVCWGHPSGAVEAEIAVRGERISASSIAAIDDGLTRLFESLRIALARGYPTQSNLFPY